MMYKFHIYSNEHVEFGGVFLECSLFLQLLCSDVCSLFWGCCIVFRCREVQLGRVYILGRELCRQFWPRISKNSHSTCICPPLGNCQYCTEQLIAFDRLVLTFETYRYMRLKYFYAVITRYASFSIWTILCFITGLFILYYCLFMQNMGFAYCLTWCI